ncbi:hypothetical protein Bbelb_093910 [Branchiostoma belcheri]|nr:hypothetical protein Bbelb_093910 [Branchiostoma belcheri]
MRQTHFSQRGPHSTSPLQPGWFQIGTRSPHTDSTDTRPRRLALPPPLLTSGHDCGVRGGWDPIPDVNSPDYRVMSARWCSRGGLTPPAPSPPSCSVEYCLVRLTGVGML